MNVVLSCIVWQHPKVRINLQKKIFDDTEMIEIKTKS